MGRATITDIARRAGVSTATVDRVLNDRAGVAAADFEVDIERDRMTDVPIEREFLNRN
jgi:AcrR family transcriptional regulator